MESFIVAMVVAIENTFSTDGKLYPTGHYSILFSLGMSMTF